MYDTGINGYNNNDYTQNEYRSEWASEYLLLNRKLYHIFIRHNTMQVIGYLIDILGPSHVQHYDSRFHASMPMEI